jgi:TRAP transporter TAXI family solute receptor
MKKQKLFQVLIAISFASILVALSFLFAHSQTLKAPKTVVIAVTRVGTLSHAVGTAMFTTMKQTTGVNFGIIPAAKTKARAVLLRTKKADFALSVAMDVFFALQGKEDFADWGPQSVRTAWDGGPSIQGVCTRRDSGIKSLADIRGKKVASYPTYPIIELYMDAVYAYANIKRSEVKLTPVSDFRAGQLALIDGSVDVALMSGLTADAYELESSIHGLRWLEMPAADTEAWARFHAVNPTFYPYRATIIAGTSKDKPAEVWAWNYQLSCYDWTNEDLVYWMAKQIHLNYDAFKDKHANAKLWTLEQSLNSDSWFAPRHNGTIRYYKDIGRWTPAMEKKQKELLLKYPQRNTR